MISTTIHAPAENFVTTCTTDTTAVAAAPTPFSHAFHFQPGSRHLNQCTTMPACDSVKQTNTPMAYSGISALVSPLKIRTRSIAMSARTMMPLEKARRSPRAANWRGM